jgi:hypothetical protein
MLPLILFYLFSLVLFNPAAAYLNLNVYSRPNGKGMVQHIRPTDSTSCFNLQSRHIGSIDLNDPSIQLTFYRVRPPFTSLCVLTHLFVFIVEGLSRCAYSYSPALHASYQIDDEGQIRGHQTHQADLHWTGVLSPSLVPSLYILYIVFHLISSIK